MLCRSGRLTGPTAGLALGYAQANLMVLPLSLADDFLLFCKRNPKPCPILEVMETGNPEPRFAASGADIRTDIPLYYVYRNGKLFEKVNDIGYLWRKDFVGFLIGCSFSFERVMLTAGLPIRHIEEGKNVPMYRTNRNCEPSQFFSGPLVVSMRPLFPSQMKQAIEITGRYPKAHGAPVHSGDPSFLGIKDIYEPDYGESVTIYENEVPVFWACGVTIQEVIFQSKPELAITHSPGCMFVTDIKDNELL
jgi:uncharacterized protein YcsI (UPF0317 family)